MYTQNSKTYENAHKTNVSDNKHGGTTPFSEYSANFSVGGREYSVTLRIKNAKQGDRYHYHTLDKIDVDITDGSNGTNSTETYQAMSTPSNTILPCDASMHRYENGGNGQVLNVSKNDPQRTSETPHDTNAPIPCLTLPQGQSGVNAEDMQNGANDVSVAPNVTAADERTARAAATKQFYVSNVAKAGLGGALSGGVMAGGASAVGAVQNTESAAPKTDVAGVAETDFGQKNTAEAAEYRADRPQNVELPSVPIINLSMNDVAALNKGVLPQSGNYIRKTATERAVTRLGLDQNPAAYIEASNVTRNGDTYVLKITKASLKKVLSGESYQSGVVPLESIVVFDNLERIANNGVYFRSEGDRRGRDQVAGYDYLQTTVYIDDAPYIVNMRVRVLATMAGGENKLYHFTPEAIEVTKKDDGSISTTGRHAPSIKSETLPPSDQTLPQEQCGVNTEDMQNGANDVSVAPNVPQADGLGAMDARFPYQQKQSKVGSNTFSGVYADVLEQMETDGGNVSSSSIKPANR